MGSRLLTAVAGLLVSLVVSAVVYYYTGWFFLFLFVPFVPLLFRRRGESGRSEAGRGGDVERDGRAEPEARVRRTCPECGYATTDPEVRYCPRDGTELA